MFIQRISRSFRSLIPSLRTIHNQQYNPTFFLRHHFLQSIFQLNSSTINVNFNRQQIYFDDGGHICLDWANKAKADEGQPIVLIMHGMTGGSETNYMKALVKQASQYQYCSICLNGRGINSTLTSPIPFVGFQFHQIQTAIERIKINYPNNPLYLVGASLGGNYVLRYLLSNQKHHQIDGLVLIAPPFDVKYVIDNMNIYYQKAFIKYYINNSVLRHQKMKFWWQNGIIDLKNLKLSKNLRQFHDRSTVPIMGFQHADILFDEYKIKNEDIQKFQTKTLILASKDDPMVKFQTLPVQSIKRNPNIDLKVTESGGHLCWFQGIRPKRWFPKPVFQFIKKINSQRKKDFVL